ncbi:MAG: hypothetical protein ACFNYN_00545, partial [Peptidiphaga gingivicola]
MTIAPSIAINIVLNAPGGHCLSAGLNTHDAPATRLSFVVEGHGSAGVDILNRLCIVIIDNPAANIDDLPINHPGRNAVMLTVIPPLLGPSFTKI